METEYGVNNIILEVNLSTEKINYLDVPQQWRWEYLGGKGLALRFLYEHLPPQIDSLSEENVLIFMTGPLSGTAAPASSRFVVVTKSPLTGIICTSVCGGPFGFALKRAGLDGILIKGKASRPTVLIISCQGIQFENGSNLWGLDAETTQKRLEDRGSAVAIGPAGENLVRFAAIVSGYRFAARGGVGAVMGSKNLKAVVARGTKKTAVADISGLQKVLRKSNKWINRNFMVGIDGGYRKFGTPVIISSNNASQILPTKNFTHGEFENASHISGEMIKNKYFTRNTGCTGCRIRCSRKISIEDEEIPSPEYESLILLGSNLMLGRLDYVAKLNQLCNKMGLDTISTGNVLGFVMELTEKGILKSDLKFGKLENLEDAIKDITYMRNLGQDMALGVRHLSEKYGGREFAMHVKGFELPGYDPRGSFGQGLGYATNGRGGCHLGEYVFGWEVVNQLLDPYTIKEKPYYVKFAQDLFSAENSGIWCIFTTYAYVLEEPIVKFTPRPLLRFIMRNFPQLALLLTSIKTYPRILSKISGHSISQRGFLNIGERVFNLERCLNIREGLNTKDDTLPPRLLNEQRTPAYRCVPLDKMLPQYYRLRGWSADGIPQNKKLEVLNLGFCR